MTGVVFTELVDFAESRLGARMPDAVFDPTGQYGFDQLQALVERVARAADLPISALLETFGTSLFARFAALYPVFFVDAGSALELLAQINTYVHGEVQKLYPDAEFPRFDVARPSPDRLELTYHSARPLADLAHGLIRGCITHFGDAVDVERHDPPGGANREARFVLIRRGAPASR